MYTTKNYLSKAALKRDLAAGVEVTAYQPGGMFPSQTDGTVYLEGPHYPQAHTWYAEATLQDGKVIKVK
jgi:hypothetical protein